MKVGDRVRLKPNLRAGEVEGVIEAMKDRYAGIMCRVRTDTGATVHVMTDDLELIGVRDRVIESSPLKGIGIHYEVVSELVVPTFTTVEEAEQWMESLNAGAD